MMVHCCDCIHKASFTQSKGEPYAERDYRAKVSPREREISDAVTRLEPHILSLERSDFVFVMWTNCAVS